MKRGSKIIGGVIILIIVFVGIILISFSGSKCPKCPEIGSYSECNEEAIKTRINYKCDELTNFECESYTEEKSCITEINLKGSIGILDVTIAPTIDEKVKGIITIETTTVPSNTQLVAVGLSGESSPPLGPGIEFLSASNINGVWKLIIDTKEYENGVYSIGISTTEGGDSSPTAYAEGQIIIEN